MGIFSDQFSFRWKVAIFILGSFLDLLSIALFIGFKKIKLYIVKLKRIRIGIAMDSEANQSIVEFCNKELEDFGLSSKIKFESFKTKRESQKKFEKLVRNSNCDVVAWRSKEIKNRNKIPVKFTYKDTGNKFISRIVRLELQSLASQESIFNLSQDTFDLDLNLEKNNIADFSLYIVAICTTLFRGINEGIFIFEKLYQKLGDRNSTLKYSVSEQLQELYVTLSGELIARGKLLPGLKVIEKGYNLEPKL